MPEKQTTTDETNPKLPAVEPAQESPAQDETIVPSETPTQDDEAVHLPAVQPTPSTQDDATEPPVESSAESSNELPAEAATKLPDHADIGWFAWSIHQLISHADEQAQVTSEYQDRWADWRNKLDSFWREVRSHV